MSFTSDMIDEVRDLTNDLTDAQVSFAMKLRYLNRGIKAMWPKVYRIVSTVSVVLIAGQEEYTVPASNASGLLLSVDLETGVGTGLFRRLDFYDILPGAGGATSTLRVSFPPDASDAGRIVRIISAERITQLAAASYVASQSEVYSGPAGTDSLPVLYAMSMITSRALDDRLDYTRYSTTQGQNGIDDQSIMQVGQLWYAQFQQELDSVDMPFPIARN